MTALQIIDNYYDSLNNQVLSLSQRADVYYNIIFTKKAENIPELYLDIKNFIKSYIQAADDKEFGYDSIDNKKIIAVILILPIEQRVGVFEFLKKVLTRFQCDEEWGEFEPHLHITKLSLLKTPWFWLNPLKVLQLIYYKLANSYLNLSLALAIFVFAYVVILLPNSLKIWPTLFAVKYEPLVRSFYLNHFMNVLLGLFEFDSDFKVMPLNLFATLTLIIGKLVKILFIVQYIIDKIWSKVNFNK